MSSTLNSQIAEIECLVKKLTEKVEELKMTQNELKNDFKIATYPFNKKLNVEIKFATRNEIKREKICNFCHQKGHIKSRCFQRNAAERMAKIICHACHQPGHMAVNCASAVE
jgi:CRISPR/Cas system CMR-associated protein Cmr1 (group 7 of RAMP superfamily)